MAAPDPATPQQPNQQQRFALWRHRDFMKLWAGDTVSVFGSELVLFALPVDGRKGSG